MTDEVPQPIPTERVDAARNRIQELCNQAMAEGYKKGYQEGYTEGMQVGFEVATEQIKAKNLEKKVILQ